MLKTNMIFLSSTRYLKMFSKRKPRKRKFLMLNREAKPTREQDLNLISILLKNRAIFPPKLRKKKLIMKN